MSRLYKYRAYNPNSLDMLINREFHFCDPVHLNDPFDCQISIRDSIEEAVEYAEKNAQYSVKNKILKLIKLNDLYNKIESDAKKCGILSLSKSQYNVLMWSHYGNEHKGFCLGFDLSQKFIKHNEEYDIIGASDVYYCKTNPFFDFFMDIAESKDSLQWDKFWLSLLNLELIAKSEAWKYEDEVRVVRRKSEPVSFDPTELVEVIFGLRTLEKHEEKIRAILKEEEWQHVKYKRVNRKGKGFMLEIVDA
jgi:hypothetical protein